MESANLEMKLTLDNNAFVQSLKQAQKELESFKKSAQATLEKGQSRTRAISEEQQRARESIAAQKEVYRQKLTEANNYLRQKEALLRQEQQAYQKSLREEEAAAKKAADARIREEQRVATETERAQAAATAQAARTQRARIAIDERVYNSNAVARQQAILNERLATASRATPDITEDFKARAHQYTQIYNEHVKQLSRLHETNVKEVSKARTEWDKVIRPWSNIPVGSVLGRTAEWAGMKQAVYGLFDAMRDTFHEALEFSHTMAYTQANLEGNVAAATKLADQFRDISHYVALPATKIAEIGSEMSMRGISPEDMGKLTGTVAEASQVMRLPPGAMGNYAAKIMNAYGFNADELKDYLGSVNTADTLSGADPRRMLTALTEIAGPAKTFGLDPKAAMAIVARWEEGGVGPPGPVAKTLKSLMSTTDQIIMGNLTNNQERGLQSLGKNPGDVTSDTVRNKWVADPTEAILWLMKQIKDTPEPRREGATLDLFGKYYGNRLLNGVEQLFKIRSLQEQVANKIDSVGAALDNRLKQMNDNTISQWQLFKNNIAGSGFMKGLDKLSDDLLKYTNQQFDESRYKEKHPEAYNMVAGEMDKKGSGIGAILSEAGNSTKDFLSLGNAITSFVTKSLSSYKRPLTRDEYKDLPDSMRSVVDKAPQQQGALKEWDLEDQQAADLKKQNDQRERAAALATRKQGVDNDAVRIAQGELDRQVADYNKKLEKLKAEEDLRATLGKSDKSIKLTADISDLENKLKTAKQAILSLDATVKFNAKTQTGPSSGASYSNPQSDDDDNVEKHALGGFVGGRLPGYGGGDTVRALLEPGEFVVNKQRTVQFAGLLSAINNGSVDRIRSAANRVAGAVQGATINPATGSAVTGMTRIDISFNQGKPMSMLASPSVVDQFTREMHYLKMSQL